MPKNTRDDMLAASLMEGRKSRKTETFRKDSPAKQVRAKETPDAQNTKVQRSGLDFFRNLRQRDQVVETPAKEEKLNPADSVWQEDEDMDWAFVDAAKTVTPESEESDVVARSAATRPSTPDPDDYAYHSNTSSLGSSENFSKSENFSRSDYNDAQDYSGIGQGSLASSQDESVIALANAVAQERPEEPKKKAGLFSFFKNKAARGNDQSSSDYQSSNADALISEDKPERKGLFDFFKKQTAAPVTELEPGTVDLRSDMAETTRTESKLLLDKADAYSPYTPTQDEDDLLSSLRSTAHDAIDSMIASKWRDEPALQPPASQSLAPAPKQSESSQSFYGQGDYKQGEFGAIDDEIEFTEPARVDPGYLDQAGVAASQQYTAASRYDAASPYAAAGNTSQAASFGSNAVGANGDVTISDDMDDMDNPVLEFDPVPVKAKDATLPGVKKTNWDIDNEEIVSMTEADVLPLKQTSSVTRQAPKPKTPWDVNDEEMESTPATKQFELTGNSLLEGRDSSTGSELDPTLLQAELDYSNTPASEVSDASEPSYASYASGAGVPEVFEPSVSSTQERFIVEKQTGEKQTNFSALMSAATPETTPRVAGKSSAIKDIPVGQKLALIALSLLLPIGLLLYFATSRLQQDVAFTAKERTGVEYLKPIKDLQNLFQEYRLHLTNFSAGDASAQPKIGDTATLIVAAIAELNAVDQRNNGALEVTTDIAAIQGQWDALKTQVDMMNFNMLEVTPAIQAVIEKTLGPLFIKVADNSNLTLDPEVESYYLQNMLVNEMPSGISRIGAFRTVGRSAVNDSILDATERTSVATSSVRAQDAVNGIFSSLDRAKAASPFVAQQLADAEKAARDAAFGLVEGFEANIVNVEQPTFTFEEASALTNPRAPLYALYDAALTTLDQVLEQRVRVLQRQNWLTLAGVAASLLLAFAIIYFITRQITRPLNELGEVSDRLAQGDFSQLAKVEARDEIGQLASSFNYAILQLRTATSQQEEELGRGRAMQQNIGQFLDVVQDIAQGDLTKRGEVTNDVLGNVVDAINLMTEEFALLLQNVQIAATSVNEGSDEVLFTSDEMSDQARLQVTEAQKARDNALSVAKGIRWMAQNASTSAEAAQRTLQASQLGQEAVTSTLRGMQTLRQDVQGVATRVQQLGKRSQEISSIVETISDIASQTNLLALGAALEAAGAGESGRRFSVVADEVGALAERAAQAAGRVSTLLASIQREVAEVSSEVSRSSQQAEQGYQVATQAGQRLAEIADISQQSAMLAETISQATSQQVENVESVGNVIQGIAGISQESQQTVLRGREAAERLRLLAEGLNDSLSRFRLNV